MNQNAISRLENPYYGKATLTTLKRIASAYDVGLLVEFVPFSRLVDRVSGTPHIDYGLSPDTMNVPSFGEEIRQGLLEESPDNRVGTFQPSIFSSKLGTDMAPGSLVQSAIDQSRIEQRGEGIAFDFTAPSASGAIQTPLPAVPTGSSNEVLLHGPRKPHFNRARKSLKPQWPRNVFRRYNNRRKRS